MDEILELRAAALPKETAGVEKTVREEPDRAMRSAVAEATVYSILEEYNFRCCVGKRTSRVCVGATEEGPSESELRPLYAEAGRLLNELRRANPTHYELVFADLASEDPLGFMAKAVRYSFRSV